MCLRSATSSSSFRNAPHRTQCHPPRSAAQHAYLRTSRNAHCAHCTNSHTHFAPITRDRSPISLGLWSWMVLVLVLQIWLLVLALVLALEQRQRNGTILPSYAFCLRYQRQCPLRPSFTLLRIRKKKCSNNDFSVYRSPTPRVGSVWAWAQSKLQNPHAKTTKGNATPHYSLLAPSRLVKFRDRLRPRLPDPASAPLSPLSTLSDKHMGSSSRLARSSPHGTSQHANCAPCCVGEGFSMAWGPLGFHFVGRGKEGQDRQV
jgi:hypothetical protein